jgi:hypothetical protein
MAVPIRTCGFEFRLQQQKQEAKNETAEMAF